MLDWVRTSEEKISVSRDALSLEPTGTDLNAEAQPLCGQFNVRLKTLLFFSDGADAFVTGIVLYRNLSSILSFHRYRSSAIMAFHVIILLATRGRRVPSLSCPCRPTAYRYEALNTSLLL